MTTGKKGVTNIGKGGSSLKSLAASALSQHKGSGTRTQSEAVAKAFATAMIGPHWVVRYEC